MKKYRKGKQTDKKLNGYLWWMGGGWGGQKKDVFVYPVVLFLFVNQVNYTHSKQKISYMFVKLRFSGSSAFVQWLEIFAQTSSSLVRTLGYSHSLLSGSCIWFIKSCAVECGNHWPHLAFEHLKCGPFNLRCAVSVPGLDDLVREKKNTNYLINNF